MLTLTGVVQGTSFSSPAVTGIVALMKGQNSQRLYWIESNRAFGYNEVW
ncbi:MAG: S8 family serine peptidase [Scytonema sp. PMC 1069.18]|nr:S8 family serine peptidase [Scytonema sp. PMC 1069.18]MEC4879806.1 S8 family serine peptidase [Scytonema sp. PMC 1070.18]